MHALKIVNAEKFCIHQKQNGDLSEQCEKNVPDSETT